MSRIWEGEEGLKGQKATVLLVVRLPFMKHTSFAIGNPFYYASVLFLLLTHVPDRIHAQVWAQKADIGYVVPNGPQPRTSATAFVVNGTAYLTTGLGLAYTERKETWQYDEATDVWTGVAEFAGQERYEASSFVIDGTTYVFGGRKIWAGIFYNDLWA